MDNNVVGYFFPPDSYTDDAYELYDGVLSFLRFHDRLPRGSVENCGLYTGDFL